MLDYTAGTVGQRGYHVVHPRVYRKPRSPARRVLPRDIHVFCARRSSSRRRNLFRVKTNISADMWYRLTTAWIEFSSYPSILDRPSSPPPRTSPWAVVIGSPSAHSHRDFALFTRRLSRHRSIQDVCHIISVSPRTRKHVRARALARSQIEIILYTWKEILCSSFARKPLLPAVDHVLGRRYWYFSDRRTNSFSLTEKNHLPSLPIVKGNCDFRNRWKNTGIVIMDFLYELSGNTSSYISIIIAHIYRMYVHVA